VKSDEYSTVSILNLWLNFLFSSINLH